MSVATYTKDGTAATKPAKLDDAIFAIEVKNHELLKQAYVTYMANGRENLAVVKTRGQVVGSTKKPWKQKGTGRARFGSKYNPIWRGGGIVFGPTGLENYSKQLNTTAKRLAVKQALSHAAIESRIKVIESIGITDAKTSTIVKLLLKLELSSNVLLVVEHKTAEITRATNNIQKVKVVTAGYVNVYDVMNADAVVFEQAALSALSTRLGGTK